MRPIPSSTFQHALTIWVEEHHEASEPQELPRLQQTLQLLIETYFGRLGPYRMPGQNQEAAYELLKKAHAHAHLDALSQVMLSAAAALSVNHWKYLAVATAVAVPSTNGESARLIKEQADVRMRALLAAEGREEALLEAAAECLEAAHLSPNVVNLQEALRIFYAQAYREALTHAAASLHQPEPHPSLKSHHVEHPEA